MAARVGQVKYAIAQIALPCKDIAASVVYERVAAQVSESVLNGDYFADEMTARIALAQGPAGYVYRISGPGEWVGMHGGPR